MEKIFERFLVRGLNALISLDEYYNSLAKETFKDEYFIKMGYLNGRSFIIRYKNETLKIVKDGNADLEIIFKSKKYYHEVLYCKVSIADSYSRHNVIIKGNINIATSLVGLINQVILSLFPRFITYKVLKNQRNKVNKFKFLVKTIF